MEKIPEIAKPSPEQVDILRTVIDGVRDHIVPKQSEVTINTAYPDAIQSLLMPWLREDRIDVSEIDEFLVSEPAGVFSGAYYLHPEIYAQQYGKCMQAREMATLRARLQWTTTSSDPNQVAYNWTRLALMDNSHDRIYPTLVAYHGNEPHVRRFIERLMDQHMSSQGIPDLRLQRVRLKVDHIFGMLAESTIKFASLAVFRKAANRHSEFAWRCRQIGKPHVPDEVKHHLVTLLVAVQTQAEKPLDGDDDDDGHSLQSSLVTLLCSRLVKRVILGDMVHAVTTETQRLLENHGAAMTSRIGDLNRRAVTTQIEIFTRSAFDHGWTVYNDGDDSIQQLAEWLTRRVTCGHLDMTRIWQDAWTRFEAASAQFNSLVLDKVVKCVTSNWQRENKKCPFVGFTHDAAVFRTAIANGLLETKFPSLECSKLTPTQLCFRALPTNLKWWHTTVQRMRVCGCDASQSSYWACMLAHLYNFLIGGTPYRSHADARKRKKRE